MGDINMKQTNTMKAQIKQFIAAHFPLARNQDFGKDERLLESGIIDSLGVLELVNYLEQKFGISIEDAELIPENFQTLEQLSRFVQQKIGSHAGRLA